jgi:ATP-binding cassette subfamily C (CFTR/MRP) protein 1
MSTYGTTATSSTAGRNLNGGETVVAAVPTGGEENGPGDDVDPNSFMTETTSLLPNGQPAAATAGAFENGETAGWWSKLTFGWMAPLMRLGNSKKKLDPDDVPRIPLPHDCKTDYLCGAFEESWGEELKRVGGGTSKKPGQGGEPSLIRALFRAFGTDYLVGGFILKFIHDSCLFVGPQVLHAMILFLGAANAPVSQGLWLTGAVTISQLTMSFCLRHYFFKCYKFGLKIRTAVVVAVYQKALVLGAGERHSRSLGEITNLMSIDAQRLQELTTYLHAIWYSFWQISLALFFLWRQL